MEASEAVSEARSGISAGRRGRRVRGASPTMRPGTRLNSQRLAPLLAGLPPLPRLERRAKNHHKVLNLSYLAVRALRRVHEKNMLRKTTDMHLEAFPTTYPRPRAATRLVSLLAQSS